MKLPRQNALAAAFSLLFAPHAALAEASAAPSPSAHTLDRVVVSASTSRSPDSEAAIPNTITVIDREQLKQQLSLTQDLSQVLSNLVPSFSPSRQKMTNGGETLRGRKPLYLVDGMPQSTPLREGGRDGHTIDLAMVERIEVIHGANALQGLGASGGIINIITKRAPKRDGESFHELSLGLSSALRPRADSAGYRGAYLFGTRQGRFDLVGGVSRASEGLYYDGKGQPIAVNNTQGDLMDSTSLGLFLKMGWEIDDGRRLQLNANDYRLEGRNRYVSRNGDFRRGLLATSVRGTPPGLSARNRATSIALDYSDDDVFGGYLQAQLFGVDFAGRYGGSAWPNFWNDGRDWYDESENVSIKRGAKLSWSRGLFDGRARLMLGLDWSRDATKQQLLRSQLNWVPETRYSSLAPFIQGEWRLRDNLMLTGGLRHERGELEVNDFTTLPRYNGGQFVRGGIRKSRETMPNLGLVWETTPELKVYASYSEGYTVADIGRVLRAIDTPGRSVGTLIDLTPVIADNREIGIDYDGQRWNAHLAAYQSESKLGSRLAFDPGTFSYNVVRERTRIAGVEGSVGFRLSERARVGLLLAASRGRYDSDGDNKVDSDLPGVNISPNRIGAYWERQWREGIRTRLQANQAGGRGFDRRGVEVARFDGYTTFDANARFAWLDGELSVGIENLLDRHYVTYHSQTTPRNDTYTAGRGRTLTMSWSRRF
ncbi:TonB-dependent receptor domain-containing protein [Solilutibacter pythonis]|nr:TonB-dependent receptor [Lysobacter pythonis]